MLRNCYIHVLGTIPYVSSAPELTLQSCTDPESSTDESSVVDKVYTVGCFDLLHRGHIKLFKNMRHMGREVMHHYAPSFHHLVLHFILLMSRPGLPMAQCRFIILYMAIIPI